MTDSIPTASTRQDRARVKAVFLVQTAVTWPSVGSVWEACRDDPRYITRVVLAPSTGADRQSSQFHGARAFLTERDVPFTYAYDGILQELRPDVVFVPLPYLRLLPPSIGADALVASGARLAYVPYGLEMGGGAYNMQYQFNLPLQNHAWRIFARSASHRRMFARYCASGSSHVVVTGAPRMDQLAKLHEVDASALEARIKNRKAILWAPHFSEDPTPAWSSFGRLREQIMDVFPRLAETHVLIFRPHPLLFSRLRTNGYWTPADEAAFRERLASVENIIFDESADYLPTFKASDAIIADAGSFLLEFFATGKPVLYASPKVGLGLNDDGHLTDHLYVLRKDEDLAAFVQAVGRGEDPMREQRLAARPQFLHMPERGTVGQAVADHVAEAILAGDDIRTPARPADERHARARQYWQASTNTYLDPADYYDTQEDVFRALLAEYGPWGTAADVGCGDGRFTLVLAEHAHQVTACDVSANLVHKAKAAAQAKGVGNIDWKVEALDSVQTMSRYDMVSCCGVLSGFLDIQAYGLAVSLLRAMVQPGGLLITKESLTTGNQEVVEDPATGYVAIYRNAQDYVESFVQQGFELVTRLVLRSDPAKGRENTFFVFRRP